MVGQGDVVTRGQAVSYAGDIAFKRPVVEFLTTLAIHAVSLSDGTFAHRQFRARLAADECVGLTPSLPWMLRLLSGPRWLDNSKVFESYRRV
jgi:hypothetical protein